ncbi:MAG: glutathione S-transferase N-terminal domain-containing protein [Stappiaceae bacterium]
MKLFEVAGEDVEFRPSPYCWRTRMALKHKGLDFEPMPWRAVEKDRIAGSGGGTVPVLVDGTHWVRESFDIADYLDKTYPDRPLLFPTDGDRAKAIFVDAWVTGTVHPLMAQAVLMDQFVLLAARDQDYYKERTVRKFGVEIEEMCADPDGAIEKLKPVLAPLQKTLGSTDYLGGSTPDYADYIVFGAFQWARVVSTRQMIETDCQIDRWFHRLLGAFDGYGAAQPGRSHWDG